MPTPTRTRSFWTVAPGHGEIRTEDLRRPDADEVLVRTLCSGISRGTELLVFSGDVPDSVRDQMRAPFQQGDLPGPVKYGYLSVGIVEEGPAALRGRRVFCLHPHQEHYVVPAAAVTPVPDEVPDHRALLAGAVETVVNATWDAPPLLGDRVAVVGAGLIGGSLAALLRRFPLGRLQLLDTDPAKQRLAAALGVEGVRPEDAAGDCDLVFHCSATAAGLRTGLGLLGHEGELVELSWFGTREPEVPLGAAFHARRLSIRASQVGSIAPARRARRTRADRMALALDLLRDPVFDALLTGRSRFEDLPDVLVDLRSGALPAICHVITYDTDSREA
jgi:threonine dehydrogenase-like Zn-dependent dehydrogenase